MVSAANTGPNGIGQELLESPAGNKMFLQFGIQFKIKHTRENYTKYTTEDSMSTCTLFLELLTVLLTVAAHHLKQQEKVRHSPVWYHVAYPLCTMQLILPHHVSCSHCVRSYRLFKTHHTAILQCYKGLFVWSK
jgi:hypothetical protein